jgi:hypothetical protein
MEWAQSEQSQQHCAVCGSRTETVGSGMTQSLTAIHCMLLNVFCPNQPVAFDIQENAACKNTDCELLSLSVV